MRLLPGDVVISILIGLVAAVVGGVLGLARPSRSRGGAVFFGILVGVVVGIVALAAFGYENTGAP